MARVCDGEGCGRVMDLTIRTYCPDCLPKQTLDGLPPTIEPHHTSYSYDYEVDVLYISFTDPPAPAIVHEEPGGHFLIRRGIREEDLTPGPIVGITVMGLQHLLKGKYKIVPVESTDEQG